jgi:hypothetical protein
VLNKATIGGSPLTTSAVLLSQILDFALPPDDPLGLAIQNTLVFVIPGISLLSAVATFIVNRPFLSQSIRSQINYQSDRFSKSKLGKMFGVLGAVTQVLSVALVAYSNGAFTDAPTLDG